MRFSIKGIVVIERADMCVEGGGLHARMGVSLVEIIGQSSDLIRIENVTPASIMQGAFWEGRGYDFSPLRGMFLGVEQGDLVNIEVKGPGAKDLAKKIAAILTRGQNPSFFDKNSKTPASGNDFSRASSPAELPDNLPLQYEGVEAEEKDSLVVLRKNLEESLRATERRIEVTLDFFEDLLVSLKEAEQTKRSLEKSLQETTDQYQKSVIKNIIGRVESGLKALKSKIRDIQAALTRDRTLKENLEKRLAEISAGLASMNFASQPAKSASSPWQKNAERVLFGDKSNYLFNPGLYEIIRGVPMRGEAYDLRQLVSYLVVTNNKLKQWEGSDRKQKSLLFFQLMRNWCRGLFPEYFDWYKRRNINLSIRLEQDEKIVTQNSGKGGSTKVDFGRDAKLSGYTISNVSVVIYDNGSDWLDWVSYCLHELLEGRYVIEAILSSPRLSEEDLQRLSALQVYHALMYQDEVRAVRSIGRIFPSWADRRLAQLKSVHRGWIDAVKANKVEIIQLLNDTSASPVGSSASSKETRNILNTAVYILKIIYLPVIFTIAMVFFRYEYIALTAGSFIVALLVKGLIGAITGFMGEYVGQSIKNERNWRKIIYWTLARLILTGGLTFTVFYFLLNTFVSSPLLKVIIDLGPYTVLFTYLIIAIGNWIESHVGPNGQNGLNLQEKLKYLVFFYPIHALYWAIILYIAWSSFPQMVVIFSAVTSGYSTILQISLLKWWINISSEKRERYLKWYVNPIWKMFGYPEVKQSEGEIFIDEIIQLRDVPLKVSGSRILEKGLWQEYLSSAREHLAAMDLLRVDDKGIMELMQVEIDGNASDLQIVEDLAAFGRLFQKTFPGYTVRAPVYLAGEGQHLREGVFRLEIASKKASDVSSAGSPAGGGSRKRAKSRGPWKVDTDYGLYFLVMIDQAPAFLSGQQVSLSQADTLAKKHCLFNHPAITVKKLFKWGEAQGHLTVHDNIATLTNEGKKYYHDRGRPVSSSSANAAAVALPEQLLIYHKRIGESVKRENKNSIYKTLPAHFREYSSITPINDQTSGLVLLTSNAAFAAHFEGKNSLLPEVYEVAVKGTVMEKELRAMREGVIVKIGRRAISGNFVVRKIKPEGLEKLREENDVTYLRVSFAQRAEKEVIALCDKFNYELVSLSRVQIGQIGAGVLGAGEYRRPSWQEAISLNDNFSEASALAPAVSRQESRSISGEIEDCKVIEFLLTNPTVISDAFCNIFMRFDIKPEDIRSEDIYYFREGGFKRAYKVTVRIAENHERFSFFVKIVKPDVVKSDSGYTYNAEYAARLTEVARAIRRYDLHLYPPVAGFYVVEDSNKNPRILFVEGIVPQTNAALSDSKRSQLQITTYLTYYHILKVFFDDPKPDNVILKKMQRAGVKGTVIDHDNMLLDRVGPFEVLEKLALHGYQAGDVVDSVVNVLGSKDAEQFFLSAMFYPQAVYVFPSMIEEFKRRRKQIQDSALPALAIQTPISININGRGVVVAERTTLLDVLEDCYVDVKGMDVTLNGERIKVEGKNLPSAKELKLTCQKITLQEGDSVAFYRHCAEAGATENNRHQDSLSVAGVRIKTKLLKNELFGARLRSLLGSMVAFTQELTSPIIDKSAEMERVRSFNRAVSRLGGSIHQYLKTLRGSPFDGFEPEILLRRFSLISFRREVDRVEMHRRLENFLREASDLRNQFNAVINMSVEEAKAGLDRQLRERASSSAARGIFPKSTPAGTCPSVVKPEKQNQIFAGKIPYFAK
ncbi:MAG: hypothetical protein WC330_04235 [Candidatus Omnitrophota bacterium]